MSRLRPSFLPLSPSTSRPPARAARRGLDAAITGLALLAGFGSGTASGADVRPRQPHHPGAQRDLPGQVAPLPGAGRRAADFFRQSPQRAGVNAEIDQRLEAAAREPEFDKRRQSFLRFQEIIARDRPSLELGPNPNVIVADRRLRDVDVNAGGIRGSFSATWLARS